MQQHITQSIANDPPLVSVLIPLYNTENYLAQCLDSVINQTYRNLEVIIVDDGSTDNSLIVANDYAEKYSYIKVYSQKNCGAQIARNKAFKFSNGEYIQYLDADDCLHHEKIFIQIQKLNKEKNTTLCFGKCEYFQVEKKNTLDRQLKIYDKNYFNPCDFLYTMWLNAEALPPLSYLAHRSAIKKAGDWDETLRKNQDGEFFARVIISSSKVIFVPESISYYRMDTPNSISKGISRQSLLSLQKSIHLYAEHAKKCEQDFTEALKTVYTRALINLYPTYPEIAEELEEKKKELGLEGYRYPKRTKVYNILFAFLGIKLTARLHNILLVLRSFMYKIKAGDKTR